MFFASRPRPPARRGRARALRLLSRRLHVFATALVVYGVLKAAAACGVARADAWDAVHGWCARRLLALSRRRRGLWVKCCQYVASRGDVLPQPYVDVLGRCLDDCPPDGREVVEEIVREEVGRVCGGRAVEDVFEGFDGGACVASASIAGVYRARLRSDGREVVLKVQHPEVGEWLMSDLRDLEWVLGVVGRAEPEFDLRVMLEAWLEKVPGEIDFTHEMQNVLKVRALLEREECGSRGGARCLVPRPVENLTTPRMFVMEYVDGCKVGDRGALDAAGVDVERLVEDITRAFGLQLIVAGYLHGDLHSGNVLVHALDDGGAPAILDYGVMVELDDARRLGFARMVIAAAENDSYALLASFENMGVELNRADPAASMELINFLFRSTVPREQTITETTQFRERMLTHRAAAAAERGAAGRADDALRRPLVDSYPGYLIFFLRTLACLRGLATTLGVQHAYLPVLSVYARRALHDACPVGRRVSAVVWRPTVAEAAAAAARRRRTFRRERLDGWRGSRLRARLGRALEMLHEHGLMIGMQVAVYHKGDLVCDMAAGQMGRDNPRPVRAESLFCGLGASEVVPALLVAQMQDAHGIGYGDRLGDRWPEYAVAGKQATTVGDLLSHATGLCGVVPPDMSMVRLRDDRAGIVRHLERAEPVHPPGSSHVHRFYDLTFGWLAAALVERVSGTPFPAGVGELAARLGISDECFCGNMPADLVPDTTTSRVASLSNSIMEDLELFGASSSSPPPPAPPTSSSSVSSSASSCAGTPAAPPTAPARLGRSSSSASLRSVSSNVSLDGGEGRPFSKPHGGAANSLELARCAIESLSASLTSDELGEAGELDDLHALPPYLLELNYFNSPTLRAACVPSATAHFSARALARLYACLANDGEVDGVRVLRRGRVAQMMNLLPHDPADPARTAPAGDRAAYGAGLRLYDVERKSGRVQERAAIGNSGLGGTMGFAIPEHKLAVAVTVNKLNLVSAASALAVHVVCKSLGAPVPTQIANMERRARAVMRRENSNDIFAALKSATASDFAQALAG